MPTPPIPPDAPCAPVPGARADATDVLQCACCGTPSFRPLTEPFSCASCSEADPPPPHRIPRVAALALALVSPLDEYAAAEVLFQLRFGGDWGCAGCGYQRATHLRSRPRLFECNRCGKAASVTAGTALHRCRVPLTKVVQAAWFLTSKESISARELARLLQVGVETAWSLGHRLRSGFLDRPVRLRGPILLSGCCFHLRPPPRKRRPPDQPYARYQVLWDRSLHVAVETGEPDHHALRRFLDRHADADGALRAAGWYGDNPQRIGNGTHHGVSDRWLPFYARAIAGWHNASLDDQLPALETLRGALRAAVHPFARLRPKQPPDRKLRAWTALDGGISVLQAWGRIRTPTDPADYEPWSQPSS